MFATRHIVAGNETIQRELLAALKTASKTEAPVAG
jgi:hypothetical protein